MSTRCYNIATIFVILVLALSVVGSGVAIAQDPDDASDAVDADETDTEVPNTEDSGDSDDEADESDEEDSGDSEENIREENQEFIENNDPDFTLPGNVEIYDYNIAGSEAVFILHNAGDETVEISAANDGADDERVEEDFRLNSGQTTRLVLPSVNSIETRASISVYMTFDERQDLGDDVVTTYVVWEITYAPNHSPDVPHNSFIVILGILAIVGTTYSRDQYSNRYIEMALRIDGKTSVLPSLIRKVNHGNITADPEEEYWKYLKQSLNERARAYGPGLIMGFFCVWGILHFFGASYAGTNSINLWLIQPSFYVPYWIEGSMVYLAYGIVPSWFLSKTVLAYFEYKDRIILKDTDPEDGDSYTYWLNEERFYNMVVALDNGEGDPYIVDHDWLFEINKDNPQTFFECAGYDFENNVAYVPWNGELEQTAPNDIRAERKRIRNLTNNLHNTKEENSNYKAYYFADLLEAVDRRTMDRMAAVEGAVLGGSKDEIEILEEKMLERGETELLSNQPQEIQDRIDTAKMPTNKSAALEHSQNESDDQ